MREEFEAHAKVRWSTDYDDFGDGLFSIQADGRYEYEHIQWDWETWKASRAALRVEDEIDRLKAENEALLLGMRAILNAYDYADQYNKEGVAVEVMEDLRTLFKGATQ
ncbi:hypothetical protein IPC308_13100 [Pseudomonas aeruginosa]|nr:hypothetical protein IPC308_13100 [Pseudomonas aeruginosa]